MFICILEESQKPGNHRGALETAGRARGVGGGGEQNTGAMKRERGKMGDDINQGIGRKKGGINNTKDV